LLLHQELRLVVFQLRLLVLLGLLLPKDFF
jgi:hypothetical protein